MSSTIKLFRNGSFRLSGYNYAKQGAYFITICTKNRVHFFGEIVKEKMILSELGIIVASEWLKTIEIRKDMNLQLGEFVVMPDHFHAVLIIGENPYNSGHTMLSGHTMHCVPTEIYKNQFGPQSKNLAAIIRGFKSAVTTQARRSGIKEFNWQSLFYEHIIRNGEAFERISKYIINNPSNWLKNKKQ